MSLIDLASLVLSPTATKEGKVYSAIPDTGEGDMTFTRGSAATRVNSEGLIEKERANLLTYSNDFSEWTKLNTTTTSGQSGYDGLNNATEISFTAGSTRAIGNGGLLTSIVNFSIYVKAGTHDIIQFTPSNSATTYANFDISSSNPATGNTGGLVIDSNITDIGGGWYRCSVVLNNSGSGTMWIWIVDSLTSSRAASVSTDGNFYIQDAQLEQGLVATDVITTTTTAVYEGITDDVPRVDYSGGGCPSLLLEPQRTNLLHYSSAAPLTTTTGATDEWVIYSATTAVVNDAIGVDGYKNATKYTNASNASSDYMLYRFLTVTSGQTYTVSGYLKLGTATNACIVLNNGSAWNTMPNDNFVATAALGYDEWKRFEITFTAPSTNKVNIHIGYHEETNPDDQSLGTFYLDSFQVEAGSYSTSLIPTYGTSTTRVAEDSDLSDLPRTLSENYTIFAEVERTAPTSENNIEFLDFESDSNDRIRIMTYNNGRVRFRLYFNDGTNDSYFTTSGTFDKGDTIKICLTYDNDNIVIYANGEQVDTETKTLENLTSLNIRTEKIKQVITFPSTLTSTEAIELTK